MVVAPGGRLSFQRADPCHTLGQGTLQEPDVAGVADDPEAALDPEASRRLVAHHDAERSAVGRSGGYHRVDGFDKARVVELTGDAQ